MDVTHLQTWRHGIRSSRSDTLHGGRRSAHARSSEAGAWPDVGTLESGSFLGVTSCHVSQPCTGVFSSHQPLLPVVCPLCKIEEIANQESESSSLPHAESVSLQFSSVSDFYDHFIRCHYLVSRERGFAKVAQFCCANNAPMARPFAVGNARRIEKHVPRRGSEGRKTQGWNLCSPKSVIESQKRADAWERIWRSDDGNGLSKYRKWAPREQGGINQ